MGPHKSERVGLRYQNPFQGTVLHEIFLQLNQSYFANNSCKDQWANSSEGSRLIVVDQDQQYKITLKIEGKLIGHLRVTNLFAQLISARQN